MSEPLPATGESSDHIVNRASAGAKLLTARGLGMRIVSVGSNLALVALVKPIDLGLLAVVRGITTLAGNTTDLGFAWALLRREQRPSREEYAALGGVQLIIGLTILSLVALFPTVLERVGAVPPEWHWWMVAALAATLATSLGTSAKIRIERDLDYKKLAFIDISSVLVQNGALLAFAAVHRFPLGVFVVTGGIALYNNLVMWAWSPGPLPSIRLTAWRRLATDFAGFSLAHVCYVLYTSVTPVLVANLFGLATAGIWSFATRLGNSLQVAFEGFRRAAIPAAALLGRSLGGLRRLADDSLIGAARLTIPLIAACYAGLPVIGMIWTRWEPAIRVGQLYALGFGLAGLASASLTPASVALKGPRIAVGEQLAPMTVGWIGFFVLSALGRNDIAWVVLPMHAALIGMLWTLTDPAVRPSGGAEVQRLLGALGVAIGLTTLGQALGSPLLGGAAAFLAFVVLSWRGPLRFMAPRPAGTSLEPK